MHSVAPVAIQPVFSAKRLMALAADTHVLTGQKSSHYARCDATSSFHAACLREEIPLFSSRRREASFPAVTQAVSRRRPPWVNAKLQTACRDSAP